ncbi:MAG: anti-sigma factor [Acidobacteria bacterium]|nr:anti-sigma factor [Acidobacteriota bacterium]
MSTKHDQRLAELLPSYALGVLDGEDLRTVDDHLAAGCATCDQELLALSGTVEAMAGSIEPVAPSDMVRARTLQSIEKTAVSKASAGPEALEPSSDSSGEPTGGPAAGLAAGWRAAIAAGLILLAWSGWSVIDLRREVNRLAADREGLRQELAAVRTDLTATRTELARTLLASRIVSAPRSRSVLLAGLEAAPESSARTYVDPGSSRAVFYASNLRPLAADETYQLWFIADGTPVSAGTFAVDSDGSASVLVEDVATFESLEAWAVTIEPAGGVPQPTGDMVLLGSVA